VHNHLLLLQRHVERVHACAAAAEHSGQGGALVG
jgi:hypothetical protein